MITDLPCSLCGKLGNKVKKNTMTKGAWGLDYPICQDCNQYNMRIGL